MSMKDKAPFYKGAFHETKLGIPCGASLYGSERPDLCLNVSELLELIQ